MSIRWGGWWLFAPLTSTWLPLPPLEYSYSLCIRCGVQRLIPAREKPFLKSIILMESKFCRCDNTRSSGRARARATKFRVSLYICEQDWNSFRIFQCRTKYWKSVKLANSEQKKMERHKYVASQYGLAREQIDLNTAPSFRTPLPFNLKIYLCSGATRILKHHILKSCFWCCKRNKHFFFYRLILHTLGKRRYSGKTYSWQ